MSIIEYIGLFAGILYTPVITRCKFKTAPVIIWALGWTVFIGGLVSGITESFTK